MFKRQLRGVLHPSNYRIEDVFPSEPLTSQPQDVFLVYSTRRGTPSCGGSLNSCRKAVGATHGNPAITAKQAHPDWHATKSPYQTGGSCWINLFSLTPLWMQFSPNCDSNTASLIPGSLDSICSCSEVLPFQTLMATSNGEHRVFLMTLISQSIRHWFPSNCFRLCSLCLKKEWGVIAKFSCQADPIHFHVPQPHNPCCWCPSFSLLFRSLLISAVMTQKQCSPQMDGNSQNQSTACR